jgi:hypothetical protein
MTGSRWQTFHIRALTVASLIVMAKIRCKNMRMYAVKYIHTSYRLSLRFVLQELEL